MWWWRFRVDAPSLPAPFPLPDSVSSGLIRPPRCRNGRPRPSRPSCSCAGSGQRWTGAGVDSGAPSTCLSSAPLRRRERCSASYQGRGAPVSTVLGTDTPAVVTAGPGCRAGHAVKRCTNLPHGQLESSGVDLLQPRAPLGPQSPAPPGCLAARSSLSHAPQYKHPAPGPPPRTPRGKVPLPLPHLAGLRSRSLSRRCPGFHRVGAPSRLPPGGCLSCTHKQTGTAPVGCMYVCTCPLCGSGSAVRETDLGKAHAA